MSDDPDTDDSRIVFIQDFVVSSLGCKLEKWMRMLAVEENVIIIRTFLDEPKTTTLLILYNLSSGTIAPSLDWPSQISGSRIFYFVKREKEALKRTSKLGFSLIYGDLSSSPIDQLYYFVDEVHS